MADAILSSIVTEIVKKLGPAAFQEIQLLCGLKTESAKLEDTISIVKAGLFDAQHQHDASNSQDSVLLEMFKEAVDDADDLLDDFSTEALRRKVMTKNKKAKKVRIFFSRSNQLFFHVKMSHKVKAIRDKLDVIAENKIKFHFSGKRPIDVQVKREESHSFVRAKDIIGRDDDKKAIVELLMDSNVGENVSVVAIVGIGGLGKTTLAQSVHSDKNVTKHFELNMWVCVSDDFNVKQVAKNIIESATGQKTEDLQLDGVQKKLREIIDGKKYFLVLDDVWNEDRVRWMELSGLLMDGAKGSKILVTTRARSVATASGVNSPYPLQGLSREESWSLFEKMAFKDGKTELHDPSLVEIGKDIVEKCSGVPLAIRVLGSLLYSRDTKEEWLSFRNKDMAKIAREENIVLPILKLSYDQLPCHLKQCFAFCRLYPKDCEIDKQQLIQLWSAHGFILLSNENEDMEDVGDLYFKILLRMSFFQDEKVDSSGNIRSCKMHDLMHDLAVFVAGAKCSTLNLDTEDVSSRLCHVSFDSTIYRNGPCKSLVALLGVGAIKLRTFFLPAQYIDPMIYCDGRDNSVYETIVSKFKRLRVLDLKHLWLPTLPSCIGDLTHLRYLDFSANDNIRTLPNSITKLQNLQTLRLYGCSLKEWPRDFGKLVSLRHLQINSSDMPRGLGKLTCLRTLKEFKVGPCNRLSELKDLNNLRGKLSIVLPRLEIRRDESIEVQTRLHLLGRPRLKEAEEANLKEKQHLQSLIFDFGNYDDDDGELKSVLEALRPHTNLKKLEIKWYHGVRLPTWMSFLLNLVQISLEICYGCKHLPKIEQLPSLKRLSLRSLESVEYIDENGCGGVNDEESSFTPSSSRESTTTTATATFFPSLEELSISEMPNLKGWWRSKLGEDEEQSTPNNQEEQHLLSHPSFPRLVESKICKCPQLTSSMPLQPTVVRLKFVEVSGKVVQEQLLTMAKETPTTVATSSSSLVPLSNLEQLSISHIEDLVTLPEEAFRLLTSLLKLEICSCPSLKSLPEGMRRLTALQQLEITRCSRELKDRCQKGEDWPKIAHIPNILIATSGRLDWPWSGTDREQYFCSKSLSLVGKGSAKWEAYQDELVESSNFVQKVSLLLESLACWKGVSKVGSSLLVWEEDIEHGHTRLKKNETQSVSRTWCYKSKLGEEDLEYRHTRLKSWVFYQLGH